MLCTWHAGMSVHLTTFYRKEDPADAGHANLLEGAALPSHPVRIYIKVHHRM